MTYNKILSELNRRKRIMADIRIEIFGLAGGKWVCYRDVEPLQMTIEDAEDEFGALKNQIHVLKQTPHGALHAFERGNDDNALRDESIIPAEVLSNSIVRLTLQIT